MCITLLIFAAERQPEGWTTTLLTAEAITAALLAGVFWWGIGFVLLNGFESIAARPVERLAWASAIALVLTGVSYIPFDLYLLRRSTQNQDLARADPVNDQSAPVECVSVWGLAYKLYIGSTQNPGL